MECKSIENVLCTTSLHRISSLLEAYFRILHTYLTEARQRKVTVTPWPVAPVPWLQSLFEEIDRRVVFLNHFFIGPKEWPQQLLETLLLASLHFSPKSRCLERQTIQKKKTEPWPSKRLDQCPPEQRRRSFLGCCWRSHTIMEPQRWDT